MPVALAGLPAVGVGLLALILLFGVALFIEAHVGALRHANIPGFLVGVLELVYQGLRWFVVTIGNFLAGLVRGALSIFSYPARGFLTIASVAATAFARIGSWTRWLVTTAVPNLWAGIYNTVANAVRNLTNLAYSLYAQAINALSITRQALQQLIASSTAISLAYSRSLFDLMGAALTRGIVSLTALATGLFKSAMTALVGLNTALTKYIVDAFTTATTYAFNLANWAVHTATGISIEWAKKYADQLVDLYGKALAGGVAGALAPSWPVALDAIDSISLALPDSIAAVLERIGAIPRAIPRDVAANVGAIAAVGTIALDWVNRCGLSLCRNAKKFGEDLQGIEDAALIIAIFDLVIDGMSAPNETAHTVSSEVGGPLAALGKDFTNIVGALG